MIKNTRCLILGKENYASRPNYDLLSNITECSYIKNENSLENVKMNLLF